MKNGRTWVYLLGFLILLSSAILFYRIFILKDYIITAQSQCNPNLETCFVIDCTEGDLECEGPTYYRNIKVRAVDTTCGLEDPRCLYDFACSEESGNCEIEYCDDSNVLEEERCSGEEDRDVQELEDTGATEEIETVL